MTTSDSYIKRVVSVQGPSRQEPDGPHEPKKLVLSEAQIAFSKSQTQRFLAPANRVFRYKSHEEMNRDMEEWVVKTLVHVQRTRAGLR